MSFTPSPDRRSDGVIEQLTCDECDETWQRERKRGTKPKLCPTCSERTGLVRHYRCELCGSDEEKHGHGPLPKRCPACRPQRTASAVRVLDCAVHNGPWVWRPRGGRVPIMCPQCAESHRFCPGCETAKPRSAFHARTRGSRDGVQVYCRDCLAAEVPDSECARCSTVFADPWRGGSVSRDRIRPLCPECSAEWKWCSRCDRVQPLTDFHVSTGKRTGRVAHCRTCSAEKAAERRAVPGAVAGRRFGLSAEQWQAMHAAQNGRCGLCGREPADNDRALAIDHCHATGRVRKLLCGPCNLGLGLFRDDVALLRAAAEYVEHFASSHG